MDFDVTTADLAEAVAGDAASALPVEALAVAATAPGSDDERDEADRGPVELSTGARRLAGAIGVDLAAELEALGFDASVGSVARIGTRGAIGARMLLVVGLGPAGDVDTEILRRAGAALADATSKVASLATDVHTAVDGVEVPAAAQALVEGLSLGAYRFTAHKSEADGHDLTSVRLVGGDEVSAAVRRGTVFADATRLARDLVNEPPGSKRPPDFADRIVELFADTEVDVSVLDESALAEGGYGGMLAVGLGSDAPPRLVELSYAPASASRHVALVGKGITFDSGGLSLKTSEGMVTMKADMGGAAAVIATVKAAAELELPVRLTGVVCLAENMPSGQAQRPGDVYRARNGTTVEVLNTDAEGRLVLSDGLSHASERSPDAIVDLATLTGAAVVALGDRVAALMATDDGLAEELLGAAERSGERHWRLPLADEYREDLDSEVADVKNIGRARQAGTIIGGLFLREFVEDGIPWAHLDIAGTAWSERQLAYTRKGGTGAPVRTLLHWLSDDGRS